MYQYIKSEIQENKILFEHYLNQLTVVDSFWESHVLDAEFYSIQREEKTIGFFSIFEKAKITSFYLLNPQISDSQTIFSDILLKFRIASAFVATSDELFLSLGMDYHKELEMQAYFFADSKKKIKKATWPGNLMLLATEKDIPEIMATEAYDDIETLVKNKAVFVMRKEDSTFLGTGMIESLKTNPAIWSIGMSVSASYRQMGIGRSILLFLKNYCYENKKIPVAGCWYQNTNSKMTLESTGFVTKSRLLNLLF